MSIVVKDLNKTFQTAFPIEWERGQSAYLMSRLGPYTYLLVVKVESSTVRDPHYLGVGRGGAGVHRAAPGDDGPSRG